MNDREHGVSPGGLRANRDERNRRDDSDEDRSNEEDDEEEELPNVGRAYEAEQRMRNGGDESDREEIIRRHRKEAEEEVPELGFRWQDSTGRWRTVEITEEEEERIRNGEDRKDEDDDEEGLDLAMICQPCRPSPKEVEMHNLTHIPFRDSCEICIKGRAQDMPHRKSDASCLGIPIAIWIIVL